MFAQPFQLGNRESVSRACEAAIRPGIRKIALAAALFANFA